MSTIPSPKAFLPFCNVGKKLPRCARGSQCACAGRFLLWSRVPGFLFALFSRCSLYIPKAYCFVHFRRAQCVGASFVDMLIVRRFGHHHHIVVVRPSSLCSGTVLQCDVFCSARTMEILIDVRKTVKGLLAYLRSHSVKLARKRYLFQACAIFCKRFPGVLFKFPHEFRRCIFTK